MLMINENRSLKCEQLIRIYSVSNSHGTQIIFMVSMAHKNFESRCDQVEYMALFIKLQEAIAMWPFDDKKPFWKKIIYKSTVYSVLTILITVSSSLALKIITDFEDMDGIATVIDFTTVYISGVFRYSYIYIRGGAYANLIHFMYTKFSYQSFNAGINIKTMQSTQTIGLKACIVYYFGSMLFILQMIVTPLFVYVTSENGTSIPLIFEGWHPFDAQQEPTHTVVFLLQAFSWLIMGYHYLLIDAFWYMIIILTIGQLQLIAHSFNNISQQQFVKTINNSNVQGESPLELNYKKLTADELKVIIRCVIQHQRVRKFIQMVENILSPIIIVDFMHAVISITFLMLDITIALQRGNWIKVLNLLEYFIVSIIHMFLFDWLGNELALQDEKVAVAIYETPWYNSLLEIKEPLLFVTAACRKPSRLTGGKFYFLTLEFFVATMRSIFSYFMVLFQLRNEDLQRT